MRPDAHALILHHYPESPFSEKVRKLLAHKGVPWFGVRQPNMMPKPDLVPLTGGYRRIPVLQIGADVYCDTQLIARVLEARHPTPTLYPGGSEGACHAWNLWADRLLFLAVVPIVFADIGHLVPKAFLDDRTKLLGGRDFTAVPAQAPTAREHVRALVATLEAQLADGRPFLLGADFGLADAACFHPLWFLRVAPTAGPLLAEFAAVTDWMARVDALGTGDAHEVDAADALAVARDADPLPDHVVPGEPNGLARGARVAVVPDDYGFDPVEGTLHGASASHVAIARTDPNLGRIAVHFPRIGFRVLAR